MNGESPEGGMPGGAYPERTMTDMEKEEMLRGQFGREDFKLVSYLLENPDIPDNLKKLFWAFSSRVLSLTNLNDKDIRRIMHDWRDAKITYLISRPHYKFTYDESLAMSNFESVLFATLKRSTGGTQRERFIIGAQIQQRIGEPEEIPSGGIVRGMKRFLGFR